MKIVVILFYIGLGGVGHDQDLWGFWGCRGLWKVFSILKKEIRLFWCKFLPGLLHLAMIWVSVKSINAVHMWYVYDSTNQKLGINLDAIIYCRALVLEHLETCIPASPHQDDFKIPYFLPYYVWFIGDGPTFVFVRT